MADFECMNIELWHRYAMYCRVNMIVLKGIQKKCSALILALLTGLGVLAME